MKLVGVTPEEIMKKIVEGERNFFKTRLIGDTNFSKISDGEVNELYVGMNNYLKQQDLKTNPVKIISSDWSGFVAESLHMPHTIFQNTILNKTAIINNVDNRYGGRMDGTVFNKCTIKNSMFSGIFKTSSFKQSTILNTLFNKIKLRGSNFENSTFNHTIFSFSLSEKSRRILVEEEFLIEASDLNGCNFKNSSIQNSKFINIKLTNSNFKGTIIKNVKFSYCYLTGTDFKNSKVEHIELDEYTRKHSQIKNL